MLSFIGNQFRKPSGFLGRIVSFLMKKGNKSAYDNIIRELEIKRDDRILEIGYGHGIGIDIICKNYDCLVTGIDFSELMFREAQLRNKRHIENNKLVLNFGDYLDFKCPPESFNKIFFINVIYFWNNIEKPFKKIKDELKQDGMLCIYMDHRDDLKKLKFTTDDIFNKYTIDYVSEELKRLGFKNIDYKFDNGYYIKCNK
ncbi:MAG: class I SAM-dependent methyltransferase [Bacteroidota bacterium]